MPMRRAGLQRCVWEGRMNYLQSAARVHPLIVLRRKLQAKSYVRQGVIISCDENCGL